MVPKKSIMYFNVNKCFGNLFIFIMIHNSDEMFKYIKGKNEYWGGNIKEKYKRKSNIYCKVGLNLSKYWAICDIDHVNVNVPLKCIRWIWSNYKDGQV